MRLRAARTVAVCTALLAGAPIAVAAQTAPPAKAPTAPRPLPVAEISLLEDDVADTASRLCPDILSGKVKLPAPGTEAWWHGYRLEEGLPKAAMDALGRDGLTLIARATLAHGTATDGSFVVALGGAAGETCRLIVYRAIPATGLAARVSARMSTPKHGWKALPGSQQTAAADKLSLLLRRDGKPYLANLLTPKTAGPVALAIVVAAVPPHVTLPQGF